MEFITDKGKINIINKTPHTVTLLDRNKDPIFTLSPANNPARVVEQIRGQETLAIYCKEIPIYKVKNNSITNIPSPKDNTFFLVSRIVAEYAQRPDLLVPDEYVKKGTKTLGCQSFKKVV